MSWSWQISVSEFFDTKKPFRYQGSFCGKLTTCSTSNLNLSRKRHFELILRYRLSTPIIEREASISNWAAQVRVTLNFSGFGVLQGEAACGAEIEFAGAEMGKFVDAIKLIGARNPKIRQAGLAEPRKKLLQVIVAQAM